MVLTTVIRKQFLGWVGVDTFVNLLLF